MKMLGSANPAQARGLYQPVGGIQRCCPSLSETQRYFALLGAVAIVEAVAVTLDISTSHATLHYSNVREQYPPTAIIFGAGAVFGGLMTLNTQPRMNPKLSCALGVTAMVIGVYGVAIKMYASGVINLAAGAVVTAWAAKRICQLNRNR